MEYITAGLEPKDALQYFEEISRIPRSSRCESAVADYLVAFAEKHGLWCRRDEANNVIIKKPASAGCEGVAPLMLQGHTDMVCVRVPSSTHDFSKDSIELTVQNGRVRAKGTTLGADDGIADAYMLAFLARDDYVHPPLECVFTSMEEIGLLGARALDVSDLGAKRMINLDCGDAEDCQTTVSCAGGCVLDFTVRPQRGPAAGSALKFRIEGLLGGHSAAAIDLGRGNALKAMARVLHAAGEAASCRVVSFMGGSKLNSIAEQAEAVVIVPADQADAAKTAAESMAAAIKNELSVSDAGFAFTVSGAENAGTAMTAQDSAALVDFLLLLPDGVRTRSRRIAGLVQTSSNAGVLSEKDGVIDLCDFIRSSLDSEKDLLAAEMKTLAARCGFAAVPGIDFGSWEYDPNSPLRALVSGLYRAQFAREMKPEATHGGLECGEIRAKIPGLDVVCVAPTCGGAHTTDEWFDIESFGKVYRLLLSVFGQLCR